MQFTESFQAYIERDAITVAIEMANDIQIAHMYV